MWWIKSWPTVGKPRATDFNPVVTIDLKEFGKVQIFWMACDFMRMIKKWFE